jgi:hypothetical protein
VRLLHSEKVNPDNTERAAQHDYEPLQQTLSHQRVFFERMTVPQVHKKNPALYGTQKFITVFTTFKYYRPVSPSSSTWYLSYRFRHQTLYKCFHETCCMPRPSRFHEPRVVSWNSSLCDFLQPSVTSCATDWAADRSCFDSWQGQEFSGLQCALAASYSVALCNIS